MVKNLTCHDILGGAASLFALTTCTAASMREKDDHFNWALGGAASGVLIGFSSKFLKLLSFLSTIYLMTCYYRAFEKFFCLKRHDSCSATVLMLWL